MNRRSSIIAGVVIAVVVLIAGLWTLGVKGSQAKAISRAHEDQGAATLKITALQARQKALLLQKAQLPAVQAQLAGLKVALPPDAALAQVIDQIHLAASTAGVQLQDLSQSVSAKATSASASSTTPADSTAAATGLQEVKLGISATGTYSQLMEYVTKLNQLARTTVVDSLTLGASKTTSAMTATISGRMFFVPTGGS